MLSAKDKLAPRSRRAAACASRSRRCPGEDGERARELTERLGADGPASDFGPYTTLSARIDGRAVDQLTADAGVVAVEATPTPRLLDERQGLILANGDVPAGPGSGYLAAHDAALFGGPGDPGDAALRRRPHGLRDRRRDHDSDPRRPARGRGRRGRCAPCVRAQAQQRGQDPAARQGCDGHGTINASIVAGSNDGSAATSKDAAGFRYGLGVEPRARLGSTTLFECDGDFNDGGKSFIEMAEDAYLADGPGYDGARVMNHSWGASQAAGDYDATAQEFDAIARDAVPSQAGAQQLVQVVAAGNNGPGASTINTPATAKNVITVGANESERAFGVDSCGTPNGEANNVNDMASSRGPTTDGRIQARPRRSGHARQRARLAGHGLLVRRHRRVRHHSRPPGDLLRGHGVLGEQRQLARRAGRHGLAAAARSSYQRMTGEWPSAAMVKAISSAARPRSAAAAPASPPGSTRGSAWRGSRGLRRPGRSTTSRWCSRRAASFTRTFDVLSEADPVRVTLAWTLTRPPIVGAAHVNDLDLEVSGAGTLYRGNQIQTGFRCRAARPTRATTSRA